MKKLLILLFLVVSTGLLRAYDFQMDSLCYNILTDQTNAVEVTYELSESKSNYSGLTNADIPIYVTYQNTTYRVTTIGHQAFCDCSSLTSVSIPYSVRSIGNGAFENCSSLTSIRCEAVTPPLLGFWVFSHVVKSAPLYVPAGSIELYRTANQWKDFTNIQAITESVIVPPELVGGEEALSELFSKTFVLPDGFLMNAFDIQIDGIVAEDGSYRITNSKIKSKYSIRENSNLKEDNLISSVYTWYAKHKKAFIWRPGSIRNEPDNMSAQIVLRYSPLFFAQTGDTLYMDGFRTQQDGAHNEGTGYIWLTYVRNRPNTLYYALARRDAHKLSLRYFDTITHQVFMVENYVVLKPDTIHKNGYQSFLTPDKHVRFRQFFEKDSMRYAEEMDSIGRVCAKYTVNYNGHNVYPQMQQKETYYPSGALQMRVKYTNLSEIIETFREDGSKAVYKPSPDAQKQLQKYFQKHFHVPTVSKARYGINYLRMNVELRIQIDVSGNMHVKNRVRDKVNWSYNYKRGLIEDWDINDIIRSYYGPYYNTFIDELLKQTFKCKPTTIDGVAIPSIMTVTFEYTFAP